MSHYSDKTESVRVDFFKESGKWGYTEAVIWTGSYRYEEKRQLMHDAFAESLIAHLRDEQGNVRHRGMTAVCLEPYHEHSHPIMMAVDRAVALVDGTAPKYQPLVAPGDA